MDTSNLNQSSRPCWVVGLDGSDDARRALRWAVTHAPSHGARIVAVSAWSVPMTAPVGVAGTAVLVDWSQVEAAVRERLESTVASVEHDGVDVETLVVQGGAARALMDVAADADLLVVGSRGLQGFRELVLGSVSRQCATHAPVPTVVVPRTARLDELGRVVVGVDGSDNSRAALQWTLDFVPATVHVDVVGACEVSPFTDPEVTRARFPDEVVAAEREFDHVVDHLDVDRRVHRHFRLGGARRALADAAAAADLVVVGARGRGAISAALLGSVSNWLLHNLECPLVVVPDR